MVMSSVAFNVQCKPTNHVKRQEHGHILQWERSAPRSVWPNLLPKLLGKDDDVVNNARQTSQNRLRGECLVHASSSNLPLFPVARRHVEVAGQGLEEPSRLGSFVEVEVLGELRRDMAVNADDKRRGKRPEIQVQHGRARYAVREERAPVLLDAQHHVVSMGITRQVLQQLAHDYQVA